MLPSASTPRLPDPAAPAANKITLLSLVLSLSDTVTVVAIDAVPVTFPVKAPANNVAVSNPVLLLNVKLVPLLGGRLPVAAVANRGKQVVSLDSSATVTLVAMDAVPVTFPVNAPASSVAVSNPELLLNVRLDPLLGAKFPVAAVENNGKQVVSLDSSAIVGDIAPVNEPTMFNVCPLGTVIVLPVEPFSVSTFNVLISFFL